MKKNKLIFMIISIIILILSISCDDQPKESGTISTKDTLSYIVKGKLECFQNSYFDKSNVVIFYDSIDGREDVTYNQKTQFILDTSVVGKAECKVIYNDLFVTFKVDIVLPKLVGITIFTNDDQDVYYIGDLLRLSNYYVTFSYNNDTTSPATNVRWHLYDQEGNEMDLYAKFRKVGVYKYVASYTNGDGSFSDYKVITVLYDESYNKTFDNFVINHEMSNGRYNVNDIEKYDDNDAYTLSFGGVRTFVEEKNEAGTLIEDLTDGLFKSRLVLGALNSTFEIIVREKMTFEIYATPSDSRSIILEGDDFAQSMEEVSTVSSNISRYYIKLNPGIYTLSSQNSSLAIYQYVFYLE